MDSNAKCQNFSREHKRIYDSSVFLAKEKKPTCFLFFYLLHCRFMTLFL